MNSPMSHRDISIPKTWERCGLPGWTYHSQAFLELEKQELFRRHWQIACHVSDLPEPGDYLAFDMCGERALLVRGQEGEVRAFHNMCRHRGARVVADEKGSCKGALVCPFHGWVYNLDGTLRGAGAAKVFPRARQGPNSAFNRWKPKSGTASSSSASRRDRRHRSPRLFKPFAEEIGHFDMAGRGAHRGRSGPWSRRSTGNPCATSTTRATTWRWPIRRCRISMAAPISTSPSVGGMSRSYAECNDKGRRWSVRNYLKAMQPRPGMPDYLKRAWVYYGLFPNAVIAVTPELVQFYQEFPLSTGGTLLRGAIYRYPDETRQQNGRPQARRPHRFRDHGRGRAADRDGRTRR